MAGRFVSGFDGPLLVEDGSSSQLIAAASDAVAQLGNDTDELVAGPISQLLAAAVRLYAAATEAEKTGLGGAELKVTPTEAVTVASALLRSQQLTPFEFAIWFSQTRGARGMEESE
jgi:hypothetical protein